MSRPSEYRIEEISKLVREFPVNSEADFLRWTRRVKHFGMNPYLEADRNPDFLFDDITIGPGVQLTVRFRTKKFVSSYDRRFFRLGYCMIFRSKLVEKATMSFIFERMNSVTRSTVTIDKTTCDTLLKETSIRLKPRLDKQVPD